MDGLTWLSEYSFYIGLIIFALLFFHNKKCGFKFLTIPTRAQSQSARDNDDLNFCSNPNCVRCNKYSEVLCKARYCLEDVSEKQIVSDIQSGISSGRYDDEEQQPIKKDKKKQSRRDERPYKPNIYSQGVEQPVKKQSGSQFRRNESSDSDNESPVRMEKGQKGNHSKTYDHFRRRRSQDRVSEEDDDSGSGSEDDNRRSVRKHSRYSHAPSGGRSSQKPKHRNHSSDSSSRSRSRHGVSRRRHRHVQGRHRARSSQSKFYYSSSSESEFIRE
ncbi:hypothetical protein DPMN_163449 [Dreissena polymorpha]|uniref:Uncharacterized protein n=1 Tax=Dreissena polymorpha TaxID=45954 RepID=A0A9D4IRC8_DREPO|nr:hypothetical protein DPMN_163449 [Dreissena polymorpha]